MKILVELSYEEDVDINNYPFEDIKTVEDICKFELENPLFSEKVLWQLEKGGYKLNITPIK